MKKIEIGTIIWAVLRNGDIIEHQVLNVYPLIINDENKREITLSRFPARALDRNFFLDKEKALKYAIALKKTELHNIREILNSYKERIKDLKNQI